jgi:hypothetical protein
MKGEGVDRSAYRPSSPCSRRSLQRAAVRQRIGLRILRPGGHDGRVGGDDCPFR